MDSLEFTIKEEYGIPREGFPVTWGIPLPEGAVQNVRNLRLISPENCGDKEASEEEIPLSVTRAATRPWEDGSLRWVFLDFPADLDAYQKKTYRLEFGETVARKEIPDPIRVEEDLDSIVVDTGPLSFRVGKRRFNLIDEVRLDGHVVLATGGTQSLEVVHPELGIFSTVMDGGVNVVVEEHNPLRAVIRAEGTFTANNRERFLDYVVRIYAYRSQPFVRILFSFRNMGRHLLKRTYSFEDMQHMGIYHAWARKARPDINYSPVKRISVALPLALEGEPEAVFGIGPYSEEPVYLLRTRGACSLRQVSAKSVFYADWLLRTEPGTTWSLDGAFLIRGDGTTPPLPMGGWKSSLRAHEQGYTVGFDVKEERHLPDGAAEYDCLGALNGWVSVGIEAAGHQGNRHPSPAATGEGAGVRASRSHENAAVTFFVRDFCQKLPKKLAFTDQGVVLDIWPEEEDTLQATEGSGCVHEFFLDFHHALPHGTAIARRAERFREPLLPVAHTDWYQKVKALGPYLPTKPGKHRAIQIALEKGERGHIEKGITMDEGFGMMFWPDGNPVGGNNLHDVAHRMMLDLARTGDRRYFRMAEAMLQHHLEVDYIWHDADPLNFEGIRVHCGEHTSGAALPGHTYLDGLVDYYHWTGYPPALEVARGIGRNMARHAELNPETLTSDTREMDMALICVARMLRETGEQVYRDACERMLDLAEKWQELSGGGYWTEGVFKRSGYYGFLMEGLYRYWKATGSERARQLAIRGAEGTLEYYDSVIIERGFRWDAGVYGGLTYITEMTGDMKYTNYAIQVWKDYKEALGSLGYDSVLAVDGVFALLEALEKQGLLDR